MTYRVVGDLISKAKIEKCGDGNFPVLSMTMHDGIVFQGERFKKQIASVDQSIYNIVRRDQLVVSFPIDEGVLAIQDIADAGIVSPAYKIWDIDQSKVIPKYLELFLRSPHSIQYYKAKLRGSTARRRSITDDDLMNMELPILSKEKQQNVIDVLNKTKGLVDSRKMELEKLDELIKARFVEVFGDVVVNPMGWQTKELQDIVTDDCSISYGIVQTGDDQEAGVPVFRPVDIVNHIPVRSELKKTTEEISNRYKRTILTGRELLITVRANIADTYIIDSEFAGCNVGRGIVPIRTNEKLMVLEFLKHQLDSKHLNDDIKAMAKGITLIQLNMEDLRTVKLIVPPFEQQKAFVAFAKQVDKSKVAVQKSLEETQLLFDSLMQQYFG